MRKVGDFLSQARKEQNKELADLARDLRVRQKYLQAIENNRFQAIPGGAAIVAGMIKKYAAALDLDKQKMAAIFRRDFVVKEDNKIVLSGLDKPKGWLLTPKMISLWGAGAVILIGGIFYFFRSFWLARPPGVEIMQPREGEVFTQERVVVKGQVQRADTVFINSDPVLIDQGNIFEKEVPCHSGKNALQIKVVSSRRESVEKVRHFFCQ